MSTAEIFQSLFEYSNRFSSTRTDFIRCDDEDRIDRDADSLGLSPTERQGRICAELAHRLMEYGNASSTNRYSHDGVLTASRTEPSQPIMSLRDAVGDSVSSIASLIGPIMTDRVDHLTLLPATQDEAANQDVLEKNNCTMLTLPSVQAAYLYAQLLCLPGALGSGLVDLEWLTALAAVVRRFTLECCGRELLLAQSGGAQQYAKSPSKSPLKKKIRRPLCFEEAHNDCESQALQVVVPSVQHEIFQTCLNVALSVCGIPCQREFINWSADAREVVLDTLSAAFGTSAALSSTISSLSSQIVSRYSNSLRTFLANCHGTPTLQQEASVVILRGLLHLLQLKEILPNGERGKLDAHGAAQQALRGLIDHLCSLPTSQARYSSLAEATNTPNHRRKCSRTSSSTPGTGKFTEGRRRRTSMEGAAEFIPVLSPALKNRRVSGTVERPLTTVFPKPRPVWSAFVGMLQKLSTTKGLERASVRGPIVDTLHLCLSALPLPERAHFLRYLLKLTVSKVSIHRLVVVEVLGRVLTQDWLGAHHSDAAHEPLESDGERESSELGGMTTPVNVPKNEIPLPQALWKALQGRLIDKVAAVRTRAALSIDGVVQMHPTWLDEQLLSGLRKRALRDETALVRRASVLALRQALFAQPENMTELNVHVICDLCQDSSLLVRNAAADSLTFLLENSYEHPANASMLEQLWPKFVLPLALESDVSSKAFGALDRVIVAPILENSDGVVESSAWRLLAHIAGAKGDQGCFKGTQQALQTGLQQLALEDNVRIHKQLLKQAVTVAQACLIDPEASEARITGVWCLLEALFKHSKQIPYMIQMLKKQSGMSEFICASAWKSLLERYTRTPSSWVQGTLRSSLNIITKVATCVSHETAKAAQTDLCAKLESLSFPLEVVGAAINAMTALSIQIDSIRARVLCSDWIKSAFQVCEGEMISYVQLPSAEKQSDVLRALYMVGELSMVGFCNDNDEHVDSDRVDPSAILRGMHEKPSQKLQEIALTLLASSIPGRSTNMENPPAVRAHAFLVLGKLCLRDERLAQSSLQLLARELHPSAMNTTPSIQSNALLVLGDLCVRYTNLADRYLPVMTSCLQAGTSNSETAFWNTNSNDFAIVRKHAVLLLSSLLLQDYIKWRGLLFHRLLVACSDENEEVATLAENVLSGPLYTRNPKLFFNHFVESLFVLNKCTAHPIYTAAANHGNGASGIAVGFEGIHLSGEVGRLRRQRMYQFLLGRLSDEEKIGVTARLAKEVLGSAANSEGDLGRVCQQSAHAECEPKLASAWDVLTDAFSILTCQGMKVGRVSPDDDEMDDPNLPNPTRQVTIAKKRLLSKISRKQLIEIVLPILCNLKVKLQASCSPLLKDLMNYLVDIFKAYRSEVKEVLANDPTMLQELEYDARQHALKMGCRKGGD